MWHRYVLTGLLILAFAAASCSSPDAQLIVDDSVAMDFAGLAGETFDEFLAAFPAHESCIGKVTLAAADELDERATYDHDSAVITARVPGSPNQLRGTLIHELAHHLEASCTAHLELRSDMLELLGRPPDSEWFGTGAWFETPSEIFAEAAVEYVMGERIDRQLLATLPEGSVELVARWAAG